MKEIKRKINEVSDIVPDIVWLIIIILLAYFPLIFGKAVMKWDIADINLPWNYFITESIKNGILPLWNPYSRFGFPLYGDPGTWYPINWLIGFFGYYDIIANHIDFIIHTFFAGWGMLKLLNYLKFSRVISLIGAICYMFSGFFISNSQHIWWLISASWLPFSLYYYIKLFRSPSIKDAVKYSIILFLMLSGGYPGLFFSTIYFYIALFVITLFIAIKKYSRSHLSKWLLHLTFSITLFTLISLIVIVSSFDFFQHINRGNPLPFDSNSGKAISQGGLPLKALISFIFPFAVGYQDFKYWGADFSILNCYFSLILLLVIVFSILKLNFSKKIIIFLIGGILALMTAMPDVFPIRYWLYKTLPLMDYFRFSSLFRIFAIFLFIIAGAYCLKNLINNYNTIIKFQRFVLLIIILLTLFLVLVFIKVDKLTLKNAFYDFGYFRLISGIKARILLQGIVILFLLLLLLLALKKYHEKALYVFLFIVATDILQSVHFNLYDTVAFRMKANVVINYLKNLPAGFPLPSNIGIEEFSESQLQRNIYFFNHNLGELFKHVSPDAFSPYYLISYDSAKRSKNFNFFLSQKIAFVIDDTTNIKSIDTTKIVGNINLKFLKFNPKIIELVVDSAREGQMLILMQNVYPYWKAYVNNSLVKIHTVCHTFIGLYLKEGKNHIKLIFDAKKIKIVFFISLISWIFIITYLVLPFIKCIMIKPKELLKISIFSLIALLLISTHLINYRQEKVVFRKENISKFLNDSTFVIINSGNNIDDLEKDYNNNYTRFISIYLKKQLGELQQIVKDIDKEYLCYVHNNIIYYPELESILKYYFPYEIIRQQYGRNFLLILKKGEKNTESSNNIVFYTDFEDIDINCKIDSIDCFSGKYCNYVDSLNIYSYTFINNVKEANIKNSKYLKVSLQFKRNSIKTKPLIIVDISRKDRMIYYQWIPLEWFEADVKKWNYASVMFPMSVFLKNDDLIKIYVAIFPGDDKVYIDDMRIEKIE